MGTYDIGGGAAAGAQASAQGIGNVFKALATAPMVAQQAEQNQALLLAKIFANQQSGSKHEQEAIGLRMTNDARSGIDAELAANPSMPPYERDTRIAFKYAGPQYMDNWSRSNQIQQKVSDIEAIKSNPLLATPTAQAYFATSGGAPFDNVGNTGRSLNRATGAQVDAGTLAKIWDAEAMSRVSENNAQAGASSALMQQRLNNPDGAEGGREIQRQRFDLANYNTAYPVNSMTGLRPIPKDVNPEIHLRDYLEAARLMRENKNPKTQTSSSKIPQETKTIGGKTYVKVGGNWYEQ